MQFKLLTFFIILTSILFVSCSDDSVTIDHVTVNPGENSYTVELSHDVYIPISFADAMFIMEECYEPYDSSLGEPELIDGWWEYFHYPEGFADWKVRVDRANAYVTIEEFGK